MTQGYDLQAMAPPSSALPIVPAMSVSLEPGEARRLREIAARIVEIQPALAATRAFGKAVRSGMAPGLWLLIGDAREIALAARKESTTYEYRLSLLAREGDLVVFGREPLPDFTRYRAETLGLGSIVSLSPRGGARERLLPLAERCRLDREVFSCIVEKARSSGGLTILPHIGMGSAWRLGADVADASGCEVLVASPPPGLTRCVNDKLWFARLVEEVVGTSAVPLTCGAHGPAALAHRLRALSRMAERVVVKVPDSAGGAGNICLESHEIAQRPLADVRNRILRLLRATSWSDAYPLLVGVWETPVLSSPSVQLWIPGEGDGPPIIEGVFEQILEGPEGTFVGSVPAELAPSWRWRLAYDALRLGTSLQHMGYFGRCSLDALLVGESLDCADLHWIECNGRWGGVSIPMTVVNRLAGGADVKFVVVQQTGRDGRPQSFASALRALDGMLYEAGKNNRGIVILSPVELEAGQGVQMLACAESVAAAREISRRAMRLLSLSESAP